MKEIICDTCGNIGYSAYAGAPCSKCKTRTCIHPELTQEDCNCLDIDGTCLVEEFYQGDWECLWETDREAVQDET